MLIGIHASSNTYFIYDPQADAGQKESVKRAIIVYIEFEARAHAELSGEDTTNLGHGNDWTYVEFVAQAQSDKYNCGVLVLLAFFRTVTLISRDTPTKGITSRWYCSETKAAYKAFRTEILHLLLDVFEMEDKEPSSHRDARAAASVPRPEAGRKYTGFFYFHHVLIPILATKKDHSFY